MGSPQCRPPPDPQVGCIQAKEQALIQGCLTGDSSCWQRLYLEHRSHVRGALFRVVGPSMELEDLVQTVFVHVHRSLPRFEYRSRLSTWMYRICVHVAMDYLRQKHRRIKSVALDAAKPLCDHQPDPCTRAEQAESVTRLNQALSRIKSSQRTVLVLHDIFEVSIEEIARTLGAKIPTVKSRLFYARRRIASHLAKAERQGF